MNKKTYIYSVSSLLQIDTPYLCHINLKISSLTAVTYCRLELQPVVTKIPKCDKEYQYKIIWLGWGSEQFLSYKAFYEPQLMSLNASYHKEHGYIWFRGGDMNGFSVLYSGGVGGEACGSEGFLSYTGWGNEDLLVERRIQRRR